MVGTYEERSLAPDWNLLRTFVAVEQGGVIRATEFRNLGQPTTGRALKGDHREVVARSPAGASRADLSRSPVSREQATALIGSVCSPDTRWSATAAGRAGGETTARRRYSA